MEAAAAILESRQVDLVPPSKHLVGESRIELDVLEFSYGLASCKARCSWVL